MIMFFKSGIVVILAIIGVYGQDEPEQSSNQRIKTRFAGERPSPGGLLGGLLAGGAGGPLDPVNVIRQAARTAQTVAGAVIPALRQQPAVPGAGQPQTQIPSPLGPFAPLGQMLNQFQSAIGGGAQGAVS